LKKFKLFESIYSDICFYSENSITSKFKTFFLKANFHLLFWYRISNRLRNSKLSFINVFIKYLCQILYSSEISPNSQIGKNLLLPHPLGIIIGDNVVIKNNVTIFQQVTLGAKGNNEKKEYPIIEDNVRIFIKASVIGNVLIGENSIIGAHSLVTKNIEKNSIYAGIPAKKVSSIE
jgi:serine O-acetyltransferase